MILKLFPICSPAVQENQLPSYLFTLIWFHFIPTSPYRFSHWQRFPVLLLFSRRSEVKPLSRVRVFATPWTVTYQAPPSMEFSRQEYWSGLPFPLSHRHIISKCTNYAYNNWPCQNVLQHLIECLEWQSIFEMLSYRKTLIIIVAENFQHSHQL